MPIYEYRCEDCGEELEKLQRMSDAPLQDCPACGNASLKRLVSAAGFRLKGGGWYETDFKQGNKRNLAGGESGGGDRKEASKAGDGDKAGKSADSKAPAAATSSGTGDGAAAKSPSTARSDTKSGASA